MEDISSCLEDSISCLFWMVAGVADDFYLNILRCECIFCSLYALWVVQYMLNDVRCNQGCITFVHSPSMCAGKCTGRIQCEVLTTLPILSS